MVASGNDVVVGLNFGVVRGNNVRIHKDFN